MYNLLIAFAAGTISTLIFGLAIGGGTFSFVYGIIPGLIAFVAAFAFLARRVMKAVQVISQKAQLELQNQKVDQSIATLKSALRFGKWQFLVTSQIDGQIGSILYMSKRFKEAEPHLKRSFKKSWIPQAMLGSLYYKRKDRVKMTEAFETAVMANRKENLLWNLYAYCLWKGNERSKAIDVLNRALKALPDDDRTAKNLKALQNNRKMKMRGWNMMWYQFHLDTPPVQRQQMQIRRR
jgi:tetratricopeptide (TPR) repeat protein